MRVGARSGLDPAAVSALRVFAPAGPRAGCAAARRRSGTGLGVGAHSPCSRLPAPRPSRGRRRPTARPGTCQPRAACTDFPEGRRDPHGDFLDSGWFACCPPSPTPEATDRSPAAAARRLRPSSRVACPSRRVSGSPAPGGLCRGSAVAAARSEHRRRRAGHLRCHRSLRGARGSVRGGGVTPRVQTGLV